MNSANKFYDREKKEITCALIYTLVFSGLRVFTIFLFVYCVLCLHRTRSFVEGLSNCIFIKNNSEIARLFFKWVKRLKDKNK